VFLLGWMRLIDRPARGRLAAAVASYALLAACAAYYMVLATVPAALYVIWRAFEAGPKGVTRWVRSRAGWLVGFAALVVPFLAVLFAANLWAATAGFTVKRAYSEFRITGAPAWGYVLPTKYHLLSRLLPFDVYSGPAYAGALSYLVTENGSYLGLVTAGLLLYALALALGRRGGASGYWWATLAVMVVLSAGAAVTVGSREVTLPAGWLWKYVAPFRLTRSVARFNLLAAVVAAVIAAAGLKHLLARLPGRAARAATCGGLAAVMVADLGFVPYRSYAIPAMPACYEAVCRLDPGATLLELPPQASATDLTTLDRTYWQSEHRLKTSAGYSGMRNARYDAEVFAGTPFPVWVPGFLDDPRDGRYGAVSGVAFRDYVWLYLTAHGYSHVVAHYAPTPALGGVVPLLRIDAELRGSKVFQDARATVYARDRLAPPGRPVAIVTAGWEPLIDFPQALLYGVKPEARLSLYNPDPTRALCVALDAAGVRQPRTVRLRLRSGAPSWPAGASPRTRSPPTRAHPSGSRPG
jgi:hypothetical protein